jgi:hypothetical protein
VFKQTIGFLTEKVSPHRPTGPFYSFTPPISFVTRTVRLTLTQPTGFVRSIAKQLGLLAALLVVSVTRDLKDYSQPHMIFICLKELSCVIARVSVRLMLGRYGVHELTKH